MPDRRILVLVEGMFCLFDGQSFQSLDIDRHLALNIESFLGTEHYFDHNHRLWVRDFHHLYAIDTRTYRFLRPADLLSRSGVDIGAVSNLFIDVDGQAWLFTAQGRLYRYDWQHRARLVLTFTKRNVEGILYSVCGVAQSGRRHYIFSTDGTMQCWDNGRKHLYTLQAVPIVDGFSLHCRTARDGRLLLRSAKGLQIFDPTTRLFSDVLAHPHINDFKQSETGELWIATNRDILRFDPTFQRHDTVAATADATASPEWKNLCVDDLGGLWACSQEQGLHYFNLRPQFFQLRPFTDAAGQPLPVKSFVSVSGKARPSSRNSVIVDSHGTIWETEYNLITATDTAGQVIRYTPDNLHGLWGSIPFCLEIGAGRYLTSVRMNRLALFEPAQRCLTLYTDRPDLQSSLLKFRYIVTACRTEDGALVGTQNGFYFFDTTHQRLDTTRFRALIDNPYSDKCNCILRIADGTYWVGTQNGLLHYDEHTNRLRRYATADGLPNACVQAITQDSHGDLWVSTLDGLAHIGLKATPPDIFAITAEDALRGYSFNERAALTTAQGTVLFGAREGICEIFPERIRLPHIPLRPALMNTWVNDSLALVSSHYDLPHDQNYLRFSVSALCYPYPQHTVYRYRLEGLEDTWIQVREADGSIQISYTSLPPGDYTLCVQAALHGQTWGAPLRVALYIAPPLWRSHWAYALYAILLIAAVLWALRAYVHRQNERLDRVRREKAQWEREQLNDERLRFFTNITHELRTPLTLILGPLDDLAHDTTLQAHTHDRVTSIRRSAQRLLQLVNQLLEFRRTETHHRTVSLQRMSLTEHVADIFRRFQTANTNAQVKYINDTADTDITADFDPEIVQTILTNLLGNAAKFTQRGTIRIALQRTDAGHVAITVSDTGCGISAEALPHIFERYYQARSHSTVSGTGIGLALAHSLAVLHGGTLEAESRVGQGSTFTLTLPLPQSAKPATAAASSENRDAEEDQTACVAVTDSPKSELVALVVEDNDEIRQYIVSSLTSCTTVLQAANGREGAELALANIPDFIVSDIMMTELDGIALCKLLKSDFRTSHIPIVLLTAKDTLDDKAEGYESGADAYLTKPFTPRLLRAVIDNILKTRQLLRNSLVEHQSDNTQTETQNPDSDQPKLSALDRRFLERLDNVIADNIDNADLDIDFLCDRLAMSRTTLFRKMKGLLGVAANVYIRKARLRQAADLLTSEARETETIETIAYRCGFGSPSYFRTCFKEEYGVLPSDYKK